jgi:hypothetical protein
MRRIHLRQRAPIDREPLDLQSFGDRPGRAVRSQVHRDNACVHELYDCGPLRRIVRQRRLCLGRGRRSLGGESSQVRSGFATDGAGEGKNRPGTWIPPIGTSSSPMACSFPSARATHFLLLTLQPDFVKVRRPLLGRGIIPLFPSI